MHDQDLIHQHGKITSKAICQSEKVPTKQTRLKDIACSALSCLQGGPSCGYLFDVFCVAGDDGNLEYIIIKAGFSLPAGRYGAAEANFYRETISIWNDPRVVEE